MHNESGSGLVFNPKIVLVSRVNVKTYLSACIKSLTKTHILLNKIIYINTHIFNVLLP